MTLDTILPLSLVFSVKNFLDDVRYNIEIVRKVSGII